MITRPVIYTPEFVYNELQSMLSEIQDNENILFKGELFTKRSYSPKRFSEWAVKFSQINEADNEEIKETYYMISETIDRINTILETRAVVGGLTKRLDGSMTKFHLINNFEWKDKHEVGHSGAIDTSNDEIKQIAASLTQIAKNNDLSTNSEGDSEAAS